MISRTPQTMEWLRDLDTGDDLASRYRQNEYADLAGEELPFPELIHEHEWSDNDYCLICGADGAA